MLLLKILHQNTQSRHSSEAGVEWESSKQRGIEQSIYTTTQTQTF